MSRAPIHPDPLVQEALNRGLITNTDELLPSPDEDPYMQEAVRRGLIDDPAKQQTRQSPPQPLAPQPTQFDIPGDPAADQQRYLPGTEPRGSKVAQAVLGEMRRTPLWTALERLTPPSPDQPDAFRPEEAPTDPPVTRDYVEDLPEDDRAVVEFQREIDRQVDRTSIMDAFADEPGRQKRREKIARKIFDKLPPERQQQIQTSLERSREIIEHTERQEEEDRKKRQQLQEAGEPGYFDDFSEWARHHEHLNFATVKDAERAFVESAGRNLNYPFDPDRHRERADEFDPTDHADIYNRVDQAATSAIRTVPMMLSETVRAGGSLLGAIQGENSATRQIHDIADQLVEASEQRFPDDPFAQGSFYWDSIPAGLASFGLFMGVGGAVGKLGRVFRMSERVIRALQFGAGGAVAATHGVGQMRTMLDPFVEDGVITPEEADQWATAGSIPGFIQILPVVRVLRSMNRPVGQTTMSRLADRMREGTASGINEAIVEGAGAVGRDAIVKMAADPEHPLWDQLGESMRTGGAVGAIAGFIAVGAAGARRGDLEIPETGTEVAEAIVRYEQDNTLDSILDEHGEWFTVESADEVFAHDPSRGRDAITAHTRPRRRKLPDEQSQVRQMNQAEQVDSGQAESLAETREARRDEQQESLGRFLLERATTPEESGRIRQATQQHIQQQTQAQATAEYTGPTTESLLTPEMAERLQAMTAQQAAAHYEQGRVATDPSSVKSDPRFSMGRRQLRDLARRHGISTSRKKLESDAERVRVLSRIRLAETEARAEAGQLGGVRRDVGMGEAVEDILGPVTARGEADLRRQTADREHAAPPTHDQDAGSAQTALANVALPDGTLSAEGVEAYVRTMEPSGAELVTAMLDGPGPYVVVEAPTDSINPNILMETDVNQGKLEDATDFLRAGATPPPVVVGRGMQVADGTHRVLAAQQAGLETIPAVMSQAQADQLGLTPVPVRRQTVQTNDPVTEEHLQAFERAADVRQKAEQEAAQAAQRAERTGDMAMWRQALKMKEAADRNAEEALRRLEYETRPIDGERRQPVLPPEHIAHGQYGGVRREMDLMSAAQLNQLQETTGDSPERIAQDATDPAHYEPPTETPSIGLMNHATAVVRIPAEAGSTAAQYVVDNAFVNLAEKVERGGTPLHASVADSARRAVDRIKEYSGRLNDAAVAAKRVAGSALSTPAVMRLSRPIQAAEGSRLSTTRLQQALEGGIPLDALVGRERRIADSMIRLNRESGDLLEERGFLVADPKAKDKVRPFRKRQEGRVYLRMSHPEFFEMAYEGGEQIRQFAEDVAAHPRNQEAEISADRIEQMIRELGGHIRNDGDPQSAIRRINAEIAREIPFWPTHWRHPASGNIVHVLHSSPYELAQRTHEVTAHRAAFVDHFGQTLSPGDNLVKQLVEHAAESPSGSRPMIDLMRALNAVPVQRQHLTRPGSGMWHLSRWGQNLIRMLKVHMLGVTAPINLIEPIGRIWNLGTNADFLKMMWRTHGPGSREYIASLDAIGATEPDIANYSYDPARPFDSITRIHNEFFSRGYLYRLMWRWQHVRAGTMGDILAERLQRGKFSGRDISTLKTMMNWSRQKARKVARGKGDPKDYEAIKRRAGAYTTNQPQTAAEMSRVEHARWFRIGFAFTTYGMMGGRHFWAEASNLARTGQETRWGTSSREGLQEMLGALRSFIRLNFNATLAGSLNHFALAWLTGGRMGLNIALEEFKDEPWKFLRDSWLYYMLAGPYGAIIRSTKMHAADGPAEILVQATFPGALIDELWNASRGTNRYADTGWTTRMAMLGDRFFPINRVRATFQAAIGFGKGDEDLHTATRAYWRWRWDEDPPGRGTPPPDPIRSEFRREMREAEQMIARGEPASEIMRKVNRAMGVEGMDSLRVRQSLLGRRLLAQYEPRATDDETTIREKMEKRRSLRNRIGDRAFDELEAHDRLLEQWADVVHPVN